MEGTKRTYDLYFAETEKNDAAVIEDLTIDNDEAVIDQENKTINITVPYGTDVSKLNANNLKIVASDNAKITVPMQGVKIIETVAARNVLANYKTIQKISDSSTTTLDATDEVILRVKSDDELTEVDYKLNVTVSDNYVKPALTSMTLRDPDGNDYPGKLGSNNTWVFEVPYSYRYTDPTNGDWDGWQIFYDKTVGAKVENLLRSGSKVGDTGSTKTVLPITVGDKKTLGATKINVTLSKGTTEAERTSYQIRIDCKKASTDSSLKSFALTTESDYDDVTNSNTYPGSIATNGKITVNFPWSDYQIITKDDAAGTPGNGLVYIIAEPNNSNVKFYYETTGTGTNNLVPMDTVTAATDGTPGHYLTNLNTKSDNYAANYGDIYVLSEQEWVDREHAATATTITINSLTPGNFTKYSMEAVQNEAKKGHKLNTITLIDPDTGWTKTLNAPASDGGSITGEIPYGFTSKNGENKIYISYTGTDDKIWVLGKDSTITPPSVYANLDATTNVPTSGVLSFENTGNAQDVRADLDTAYLTIDRQGNVTLHKEADNSSPCALNYIRVTNEDGTAGKMDYNFNLRVAEPNTGSSFLSFSLGKYTGVIGKDGQGRDIITVTVPFLTDVTYLTPSFTLSQGAVVKVNKSDEDNLLSGTEPFNFSTPRQFTVVSEGGNDSTTYTITVKVAEEFTDVSKDAWYYQEVMDAVHQGLIAGYDDGTFKPAKEISRGDFALMIARMLNGGAEKWNEIAETYETSSFVDVNPDKHYAAAITWCVEQGYVSGIGDNKFNPERTIKREEMAKFLCRVAELSEVTSPANKFADDASISGWAKGYVYAVADAGIMNGVGGNKFNPKRATPRCEAAAALVRYNKSK